MAVTVAQLAQDTLRELSEQVSSSLGIVGDGSGVDSVSTTETLYEYITQAATEWCEIAWPLPGSATLAAWPAQSRSQMLHALTHPPGQGRLHAITGVAVGAPLAPLERISLSALKQNIPGAEFTASGSSLYYYVEPSFVGLHPSPASSVAASFVGYAVPLKASGVASATTANSYSFAPDDILRRVIPVRAAILLAEKGFDDPNIFGRIDHLRARWVADLSLQRSRLSEETLQHFKMLPSAPQAVRGR
jgi:hypothetical protein